ncbi:hypothetical protein MMC25_002751 [Agyrium rufum]|nr:hypothetical protein [Agyrium rufum]
MSQNTSAASSGITGKLNKIPSTGDNSPKKLSIKDEIKKQVIFDLPQPGSLLRSISERGNWTASVAKFKREYLRILKEAKKERDMEKFNCRYER